MLLKCPDSGEFQFLFESEANRKQTASKAGIPVRAQFLLSLAIGPAKGGHLQSLSSSEPSAFAAPVGTTKTMSGTDKSKTRISCSITLSISVRAVTRCYCPLGRGAA